MIEFVQEVKMNYIYFLLAFTLSLIVFYANPKKEVFMKKSRSTMNVSDTSTILVEALKKLPSSEKWFKLTAEEKAEFRKARLAEEQSKKAGFILGGSLKQII